GAWKRVRLYAERLFLFLHPVAIGIADIFGGALDVPDQTHFLPHRDDIAVHIDLPPHHSGVGGAGVLVMVIVPAIAKGHPCHEPVVARAVPGIKALRTKDMADAVHAHDKVEEKEVTQKSADQDGADNMFRTAKS